MVMEEITQVPFKNEKRIFKKFRELINNIGEDKAAKIRDSFAYSRDNEGVADVFEEGMVAEEETDHSTLFEIIQMPKNAKDFVV